MQKAVDELGNEALPYYMSLAPVRMLNDNDREMNVYEIGNCINKMNEIRKKNNEIAEFKNYIKDFNTKYAVNLNKYLNKESAEFGISDIYDICDAFLSNYEDKREMKEFKEKSGIDFEVLKEDCFDFNGKYFFYSYYGDENRTLAHVDSSKLFREELYFMKRRLDADITPENEDAFERFFTTKDVNDFRT